VGRTSFSLTQLASAEDIGWCANITSPGIYTLNTSINSAGTCFNVTGADVIIDCNSFTINYASSATGHGVYSNSTNTTVKNCNINTSVPHTSTGGIYFKNASNGTVFNNNITSIGVNWGISLGYGTNNTNVSYNNITTKDGYGVIVDYNCSNNFISYSTIHATGSAANSYGVLMQRGSNNNDIFGNNITVDGTSANSIGIELWTRDIDGYPPLYNDSVFDNNVYSAQTGIDLYMVDRCSAYNNNVTAVQTGIHLQALSSNSSIHNNNITAASEGWYYGVYIDYSAGNLSVINNNILVTGDYSTGIYLEYNRQTDNPSGAISHVNNNNITMEGLGDSSGWGGYGIYFYRTTFFNVSSNNINTSGLDSWAVYFAGSSSDPSSNNTFNNNVLNAQNAKDIVLGDYSHDNIFMNETIGEYFPTKISYTYSGNFEIDGVEIPPSDPVDYSNISKYVNVTNLTGSNWLFLNISYSAEDIPVGKNESLMVMLDYNSTDWKNVSYSLVDIENKTISGNATSFSILVPLVTASAGGGDSTNPVAAQGANPADSYNSTSSSVTFDMKCYDNVAVSMIQLWTNTTGTWGANYTNDSYTNDTWLNITVPGISDAQNYKWAVWCNDTASQTNITENRTFNINYVAPTILWDGGGDVTLKNNTNVTNQTNPVTPSNETNQTKENAGAQVGGSSCGDNRCDVDETSKTCCKDCRCSPNSKILGILVISYDCTDNGCMGRFNWRSLLYLIILIAIILIILPFVYNPLKRLTLEKVVQRITNFVSLKKKQEDILGDIKTKNRQDPSDAFYNIQKFNNKIRKNSGWGIKLCLNRRTRLRDRVKISPGMIGKMIDKKKIPYSQAGKIKSLDSDRMRALDEMADWFGKYKKLVEKEKILMKSENYKNLGHSAIRMEIKNKINSVQAIFEEETNIARKLKGNLDRLHKDEDGILDILHHKEQDKVKKLIKNR